MDSFNPLGMSGTPEMTEEERQKMLAEESIVDDPFALEPLLTKKPEESTGSPCRITDKKRSSKPDPHPKQNQSKSKNLKQKIFMELI